MSKLHKDGDFTSRLKRAQFTVSSGDSEMHLRVVEKGPAGSYYVIMRLKEIGPVEDVRYSIELPWSKLHWSFDFERHTERE